MFAKDDDRRPMTEAEYLAFDDSQPYKYEYRNGEVIDMVGGTARHAKISMNVGTLLNNQLQDSDCSVISSDMRVYIQARSAYRYPDVTVYCGDGDYQNDLYHTLTNPVLVVEVMSPSSIDRDQRDKLDEYTQIPSLQAYVLVSQNTQKIEIYLRQTTDNTWLYQFTDDPNIQLTIPTLNVVLRMADVYRKVNWDTPPSDEDAS